jgi:mannosyltransferase OCH1-like enzyme
MLPYIENYDAEIAFGLKEKIEAAKEKRRQIPKKIHYFGLGDCMESWRKFCPDYEIIRWNKADASDSDRLDIIYENGGIYFDSGVEIIKPLDDLLFHKAFIGFSSDYKINLGSGFGAKKHSKIIRTLRDNNLNISLDNSFQNIDGLAVYPKDFFNPLNKELKFLKTTKNTYSINQCEGSVRELEDYSYRVMEVE